QQHLLHQLYASGLDVVTAGLGTPYDLIHLPEAPNFIATYCAAPVSVGALARLITGEIAPSGKLPVDILSADDPDQVLYGFGYGLSW
ncbi:MAG: glycoside hydrolase family 3 C-terminal domain-containing protein, partial [Microlunatus sp.]|nr:glycoside hydrolase family 3 C-terminal domain-containing protein [Microlunatus sp.]